MISTQPLLELLRKITEELYDCTASNGVSSHTGSVGLKGACTFLLSRESNVFACASVHLSMCVYVHVLRAHDQ